MLEVHRQSGGFTPPAQLNVFDFLFNRGGMPLTIPLGPAPRNVYPACLRAPREIHISDSAAYFTGVGSENRTGACLEGRNDYTSVECLDLVNQGHVNPLGEPYFTGES